MADLMQTAAYRDHFAGARAALPGAGLAWLGSLRGAALARFAQDGFPAVQVEEWKYSNLNTLAATNFVPAQPVSASLDGVAVPADASWPCLTFVNGFYRADLSSAGELPSGVTVLGLAQALAERPDWLADQLAAFPPLVEERLSGQRDTRPHALAALNDAFMADGAVVLLDRGVVLDTPLHIRHIGIAQTTPVMVHPRNLIIAEDGAEATILESYEGRGKGAHWTNAVTQVRVGAGARLRHYRLQAEGGESFHIAAVRAHLDRDSTYENFILSVGAAQARNEIRVRLEGTGANCALNGIYLARGAQNMDSWTRVDHLATHGTTTETYKGVMDDTAAAAFQGKIHVSPQGAQTSAHQLNQNLLLSDRARVASKPELEILTDDVKCSHGSTVGDLDADALFFLRARGLDADQARRLLIEAFVTTGIDALGDAALRPYFRAVLDGWIAASETGA